MMALAATGRTTAARHMLSELRDFGRARPPLATVVRTIARPVTEAVLANLEGRHADALWTMRPVLGKMYRFGGSHAQQDVLGQVFLDSALKAGADENARLLLERVSGCCRIPPAARRGYAMAAPLLQ